MIPKRVALVLADYPELEKYCPNFNGMRKGLEDLKIDYKFISARPSFQPKDVYEYEPDLVVYGLIDILKEMGKCNEIRKQLPNAKIVFWYGDFRDKRTGFLQGNYSRLIDAMFVSNDAQSDFWKQNLHIPEVHYLPLGCTPIEKPIINTKFDFPFVFVGGLNGTRAFINRMNFVQEIMSKSELKIISSYEPKIRSKVFQAMPEIYSTAKVILDVSHFTDVRGYTSNRFFIIPAYYGLPITKRFPGCEELYPSEIRPYFDTIEEALALKDYYISHPKERLEKIKKLHEWSYNHTYDKRWLRMFELLN
jgi:hypothetical protein